MYLSLFRSCMVRLSRRCAMNHDDDDFKPLIWDDEIEYKLDMEQWNEGFRHDGRKFAFWGIVCAVALYALSFLKILG